MGSWLKKLKGVSLGKLLAWFVTKLAEGDFGAGPAKVYWALAGVKTWIAFGLVTVMGVMHFAAENGFCAPCEDYVATILKVVPYLIAAGIYDAAIRYRSPQNLDE
jgi:hypothetical protein